MKPNTDRDSKEASQPQGCGLADQAAGSGRIRTIVEVKKEVEEAPGVENPKGNLVLILNRQHPGMIPVDIEW